MKWQFPIMDVTMRPESGSWQPFSQPTRKKNPSSYCWNLRVKIRCTEPSPPSGSGCSQALSVYRLLLCPGSFTNRIPRSFINSYKPWLRLRWTWRVLLRSNPIGVRITLGKLSNFFFFSFGKHRVSLISDNNVHQTWRRVVQRARFHITRQRMVRAPIGILK